MTQTELATELNTTQRRISQWENGKGKPPILGELRRISDFFQPHDRDVYEWLREGGEMPRISKYIAASSESASGAEEMRLRVADASQANVSGDALRRLIRHLKDELAMLELIYAHIQQSDDEDRGK